ncbi:MAG: hypothetical protein MUC47_09445 [Candidatus Kapabacteria bacterium]|nr:hypothetical protein [Candidatus Kapabacteria bacterium]
MSTPIPPVSAPDDFEDGVRLKLVLSRISPVVAPDAFETSVLHALREGGPAATSRPQWLVPILVTMAGLGIAVLVYLSLPTSIEQAPRLASPPAVDTLHIPAALHPPADVPRPTTVAPKRKPRLHGVAGY